MFYVIMSVLIGLLVIFSICISMVEWRDRKHQRETHGKDR